MLEKTLIIIPVFNEQDSLKELLDSLVVMIGFDIVVVNDASTDASLDIASAFPGVTVLPLHINLGAWGAIQTGLRYAYMKGYQRVLTMDGDGQHHIEEISKLLQVARNSPDVDVVIGACTRRGSKLRHWAWAYFRRLTGVGIEDITSGFRLYNFAAVKTLVRKRGTLLDFQDVGVLLLLQEAGLKVMEAEVKMSPRKSGKSHIYYSWFAVTYYMVVTTVLSISKGKPFKLRKAD